MTIPFGKFVFIFVMSIFYIGELKVFLNSEKLFYFNFQHHKELLLKDSFIRLTYSIFKYTFN